MSVSTPKFSVVVPACARPEQLALCLSRLAPGVQTYPANNYEVIVTDDSPDQSVRDLIKARFAWVQWTAGPRLGPAANRNHGAKLARGEWLAFTDDDCLPEAGWLASFAEAALTQPGYCAFEGPTVADRPQRQISEAAPLNTHGGYLWSCNLVVRRSDFVTLQGFDERFRYASMEDVDFRERLKASGRSFTFVPTATICHPWRIQNGLRALARSRDSFYLYLRLHPEISVRPQGLIYLRLALRELLRDWPRFWLRGSFRGGGTQLAKIAVHTGMGLRMWMTGRTPQA